jgi:hypothetical protein
MTHPRFEALESRLTLTTNYWTGQAALAHQDYSWSNVGNWSNGKVESGQDLVFPVAGPQTFIPTAAIANDLTNLTIDSIEIDGSGYTIGGDAITLSAATGLFTTYTTGVSAFNIDTDLTAGNIDIAGGGELDINGTISGNAGFNVSGGGTVGGTGQVSALAVQASTVQPGVLGIGSLRVQGGATFYPNSTFSTELDSSSVNSSLAATGGTVVLENPALNVSLATGFAPAPGNAFTIIQGTVTGAFNNEPEGAAVSVGGSTFRISYHQGAVLTAVAPTTIQTTEQDGITTSVFGQSLTFVATLNSGGITPNGVITFEDGGVTIGSARVSDTGTATLTVSNLALGSHAITSVYTGDSMLAGSTSPELDITVNQASTSTTLTSSANPSVFGQFVNLTAKVAAVAPGSGTPTGTVDFKDGTTDLGEITLNGGTAILTTTLSLGNHSIAAVYSGDTNFKTSTATAISQNVNDAPTTTTLSSSANPSVFGESVSFTAMVAPKTGTGTPTGSVSFFDGSTKLGTVELAAGSASFSTSDLTRGSHSITAVYSGDTNFVGSTSDATSQAVNQASTQTVVMGAPADSILGQSVTFTANVSAVSPGAGMPTGSVTFLDGSTELGTMTLSAGAASISTSSLTLGSHSITAQYSGDTTDFLPSTSAVSVEVVGGTTVALVSSTNPSTFGQSVSFTATVTADAAGSSVPTGSVTFMDGTQSLGTMAINGSGVASISAAGLSGGTHKITAVYGGAADFVPSTSTETDQVVNPASTSTALVASASQGTFGQSVTFTATVTGGAVTPTGTVMFEDGSTVLATVGLNASGVATYTSSALAVGGHSVVAVYSGSDSYTSSSSSKLTFVVGQAGTTTTVASSTATPAPGQLVTITATVAPVAPGAGAPTGTVVFHDGSAVIGSAAVSAGQASITVAFSGLGSRHLIEASYQGSAGYSASGSANETLTVQNPTATTTLIAKPQIVGRKAKGVTFQIIVQAGSAGLPVPGGSVVLEIGKRKIRTLVLANGSASVTLSKVKTSGKTFVVHYLGDATYKGGLSNSVRIAASFFKAKV